MRNLFALLLLGICVVWNPAILSARETPQRRQPSEAQALSAPIGLAWEETPIRDALAKLSRQTSTAIWLDRRVDANLPISGAFQNATLPQILRETLHSEVLEAENLELTQLGPVLFVGPAPFAARLRTLSELKKTELRNSLSKSAQKKWLADAPLSWPRLAEPKEILKELADANDLKVDGLQSVPHDLWPEHEFPALCALDAALLILGQFDLTLEFEDSCARIVPLELESAVLTKSYPARQVSESRISRIRETFPDAKIKKGEKQVIVRGAAEVHDFLRSRESEILVVGSFTAAQLGSSAASGGTSARAPDGQELAMKRFSGKISIQFFLAVRQLCQQNGLTLEADPDALVAAGVNLDQMVTLEVQDVTIEELFQKLAEMAGCEAKLTGKKLILSPAGP